MTVDERAPLLDARDLVVEYRTPSGRVRSLDAASLVVRAGEIVALVGESGSGKSTLGMAAGRMLAANARYVGGGMAVQGVSTLEWDAAALQGVRREVLGFIFQNPVAALDPTMRVEAQMRLAATGTADATPPEQALGEVGLRDVPRVLRSFPHQLSGGMAQRVGIAMALQRRPKLLIADEPTAAVDATLRAQILSLLVERCRAQGCALLLLTHDLQAVATHSDRIAVMYGGRVVETGPTGDVLRDPVHPYTRALLHALPGDEVAGQRLEPILGIPPVLRGESPGCAFAARCPDVLDVCGSTRPVHDALPDRSDRTACCHLVPRAVPAGPAEGSAGR